MIRKIIRKLLRWITKYEIKHQSFAIGINSYVDKEKDLHIVMLDYDTLNFDFVLNDSKELANFFNLSDFEIYATKKGHHVFFFYDIVPHTRLKMIVNYSNCDTSYKYISRFYDYKTLRASGKYKEQDITFVGRFDGKRTPTRHEREIGGLKRMEYLSLKKLHLFQEEILE